MGSGDGGKRGHGADSGGGSGLHRTSASRLERLSPAWKAILGIGLPTSLFLLDPNVVIWSPLGWSFSPETPLLYPFRTFLLGAFGLGASGLALGLLGKLSPTGMALVP